MGEARCSPLLAEVLECADLCGPSAPSLARRLALMLATIGGRAAEIDGRCLPPAAVAPCTEHWPESTSVAAMRLLSRRLRDEQFLDLCDGAIPPGP
jgi:hypothetical protein